MFHCCIKYFCVYIFIYIYRSGHCMREIYFGLRSWGEKVQGVFKVRIILHARWAFRADRYKWSEIITPIDGRKYMGNWGYVTPYRWSYGHLVIAGTNLVYPTCTNKTLLLVWSVPRSFPWRAWGYFTPRSGLIPPLITGVWAHLVECHRIKMNSATLRKSWHCGDYYA